MKAQDYKYDVAFSFLKEDENLAQEMNDSLRDKTKTFLYSKRQDKVAGTAGENTFNKVFGQEARIFVVLYRNGWGNSPWTRIEAAEDNAEGEIAGYMNRLPKVVCSRKLKTADWNNTTIVKDAAVEIPELKQQGNRDMYVFGSVTSLNL